MVKIGVLVSGGGTNLQQLIDAQAAGNLGGGAISVVISSKPGVYALQRAEKAGIEAVTLSRKDYPDVGAYSSPSSPPSPATPLSRPSPTAS